MSKDTNYLHFPLHFLRRTWPDPLAGLDFILRFGVCNYAAKVKTDPHTVAMQTLYVHQRGEAEKMPVALADFVDQVVPPDEDFKGFAPSDNGHFRPYGLPELAAALQQHPDRHREAVRMYQLRQVAGPDQFNIDLRDYYAPWDAYDEGMDSVEAFNSKYGADVWPSCKLDLLFDVFNQPDDIDVWRGYIAIKSLYGHNRFTFTHKSVVHMRMAGAKSKKALSDFGQPLTRYSKRYWMDRLLTDLEQRGFITKISYGRGIYVTHGGHSKKELANMIIEKKRSKAAEKQEKGLRQLIKTTI